MKPAADLYKLLRAGTPILDPTDTANRSKLKELIGECQHALSRMPDQKWSTRIIDYTATNNTAAAAVRMVKSNYRVDNAFSHLYKKFPREDELPSAKEALLNGSRAGI